MSSATIVGVAMPVLTSYIICTCTCYVLVWSFTKMLVLITASFVARLRKLCDRFWDWFGNIRQYHIMGGTLLVFLLIIVVALLVYCLATMGFIDVMSVLDMFSVIGRCIGEFDFACIID